VLEELRAQGVASLRAVAEVLNDRGMLTRRGGRWWVSNVRNLIRRGSVAQISRRPQFPFPWADSSYALRDGNSERGVSVQDGNADMEFGDLAVEVPCHEALPQEFHAMHLGFDAASAVVSAPSSPERAAQVSWRPQGLVADHGSRGGSFPRPGVPARRDDGMRAAMASWHLRVS